MQKAKSAFEANVIEQMLCHHSQPYPTNNPLSKCQRPKVHSFKCHWVNVVLPFSTLSNNPLSKLKRPKHIWANVTEQMLCHHFQLYPINNQWSKLKRPIAHLRQMSLSKCCVAILNFIQQIIIYINAKGQKCIYANVTEQMLCHHSQLYPINNPWCKLKRPKVHLCKCHWTNVVSPFSTLFNE